ncbi:MAG: hypothetical protein R2734_10965 [Nocardioides sp.]
MTRSGGEHAGEHHPPSMETVESVVRRQLATALGGRRGMLEAAAPPCCSPSPGSVPRT